MYAVGLSSRLSGFPRAHYARCLRLPPIAGGAAVVAGVVLVIAGSRTKT